MQRGAPCHCSVRPETGGHSSEAWQRDAGRRAWVTARDPSQPRLYRGAHSWDTVVPAWKSPSVATLLPVCSRAGPEGAAVSPRRVEAGSGRGVRPFFALRVCISLHFPARWTDVGS